MKKTQEMLGLPIISISDGMEVGKVKSVIINADKGAIDYIVVDSGIQILSARVIASDSVLGIGEYALTIENEDAISDISKIPAAIDLLQKNIQVRGTKVLTKKGRLIGEIGDIFIDEDNGCMIEGLEFIADITQKKVRIIPRESVITFGKNLVIVKDDVENYLLDSSEELGSSKKDGEIEKKNSYDLAGNYDLENGIGSDNSDNDPGYSFSEAFEAETEDVYQNFGEVAFLPEENGQDNGSIPDMDQGNGTENSEGINNNGLSPESSAADLFEQRQREYLIGRRATKTITDAQGKVIISEGMLINSEIIDEAKASGKLIELVMNNKG